MREKKLVIALTTYHYPRTLKFFSDSQALVLVLSAIRHFVGITLFIASTPPEANSAYRDEDRNSLLGQSQDANLERGCACFQKKYVLRRHH